MEINLETIDAVAKEILETLSSGDVVLLSGDLGAGKTTFTQALARVLGVKQQITSPTFTIMNLYETPHPSITQLCHIDTYRLESPKDFDPIGMQDFFGTPGTLCVVEWPEHLPGNYTTIDDVRYVRITFSETEDPTVRNIEIA